jgi:hypothetical protein
VICGETLFMLNSSSSCTAKRVAERLTTGLSSSFSASTLCFEYCQSSSSLIEARAPREIRRPLGGEGGEGGGGERRRRPRLASRLRHPSLHPASRVHTTVVIVAPVPFVRDGFPRARVRDRARRRRDHRHWTDRIERADASSRRPSAR